MDYLTLRYLSHSGVKGQKWGVRRWQNADGSLTPEGRIHYGLGNLDYNARYSGDKKSAKKAYKAERKQLIKNIKNVTSKEAILLGHDSPLLTSRYQAGLREVNSYLAGKYGQETIDSIKRDTRLKGEAIALATIGTGLMITSVAGLSKINKDKKQRAANEVHAAPRIEGPALDETQKQNYDIFKNAAEQQRESAEWKKKEEERVQRNEERFRREREAEREKERDEAWKRRQETLKRLKEEAENKGYNKQDPYIKETVDDLINTARKNKR